MDITVKRNLILIEIIKRMQGVWIYCDECGFLNCDPDEQNKCKGCFVQLSAAGAINPIGVTLIRLRTESNSKKIKKKIAILEQNETTIQEIIHRIKKKGGQYLFQDDEITDLLKQVLKKNLTSEKLDLEKDLRHTRLLIRRLRQDLGKIYTKETTHQNKFQSLSLFKLLKEKETS